MRQVDRQHVQPPAPRRQVEARQRTNPVKETCRQGGQLAGGQVQLLQRTQPAKHPRRQGGERVAGQTQLPQGPQPVKGRCLQGGEPVVAQIQLPQRPQTGEDPCRQRGQPVVTQNQAGQPVQPGEDPHLQGRELRIRQIQVRQGVQLGEVPELQRAGAHVHVQPGNQPQAGRGDIPAGSDPGRRQNGIAHGGCAPADGGPLHLKRKLETVGVAIAVGGGPGIAARRRQVRRHAGDGARVHVHPQAVVQVAGQ